MKAISLWQPWASAIALDLKRIETRGRRTRHRGAIAIHAAKRWTEDERDTALHFSRRWNAPGLLQPPLGAIIAVANIVDVIATEQLVHTISEMEESFGNYAPGRYGWLLEDITALETPIPWRGMQGMFDIPDEVVQDSRRTTVDNERGVMITDPELLAALQLSNEAAARIDEIDAMTKTSPKSIVFR